MYFEKKKGENKASDENADNHRVIYPDDRMKNRNRKCSLISGQG